MGGKGPGTLLDSNHDASMIRFVASAGAHFENITLEDFSMSRTDLSSSVACINAQYVDNLNINKIRIPRFNSYGIYTYYAQGVIQSCDITGAASALTDAATLCYAIGAGTGSKLRITQNYIHDYRTTITPCYGIAIDSGGGTIIQGNAIDTLTATSSSKFALGVYVNGSSCTVVSNSVRTVTNTGDPDYGRGISVSGDYHVIEANQVESCSRGIVIVVGSTGNTIGGNYCINNGSDTGVANTNRHNFYDGGTDTQVG
jgi:nitrous oxidase accessory protein NosD